VKVIVIDDMVLVREGIVRILRDHGIDVAAAAGSAEPVHELVAKHDPDVVILDIRMPPTRACGPRPRCMRGDLTRRCSCSRSTSMPRTRSSSSARLPSELAIC
jgi:DNA-binding NarL/FixJ family response regulator